MAETKRKPPVRCPKLGEIVRVYVGGTVSAGEWQYLPALVLAAKEFPYTDRSPICDLWVFDDRGGFFQPGASHADDLSNAGHWAYIQ